MKSVFSFFAVLLVSVGVTVAGMDVAEAKRLGGGKSFGGKFSQSQNVKRTDMQRKQTAAPQTAAQTQNAARKQQMASKGGMMGMLGALAIGGLLGALFFGGAFEGFNFFDFAMIALMVFAAFMIFKALMGRNRPQPAAAGGPDLGDDAQYRDNANADIGGGSGGNSGSGLDSDDSAGLDSLRGSLPKGFDGEAFIDGAKNCYARLQRAWDDGDLADIRQFTTDHAFAEIQEQYHNRIGTNQTEIVSLEAELLNVNELGSKSEAAVLFNAELQENGQSVKVSEVWHFVRPTATTQPTWFLEGIQQVED